MEAAGLGRYIGSDVSGDTYTFLEYSFVWGFKINVGGDCSYEIERHLFLGRKVMKNLNNILKSRDITCQTRVHMVKTMDFPVVMHEWM